MLLRKILLIALGFSLALLVACNYPGIAQKSASDLPSIQTAAARDLQATLDAISTEAGIAITPQMETPTLTMVETSTPMLTPTSTSPTVSSPTTLPPPPTSPPPTNPPPPTSVQTQRTSIAFRRGATSANLEGSLPAGGQKDYSLRAMAGQTLMANIYSGGDSAYLGVTGADGIPMLRLIAEETAFRGELHASQSYYLSVACPFTACNYTLQTIVPARIKFPTGSTSTWLEGSLTGGEVNYYLAWGGAGQTMSVTITSPNNDVLLTVYGFETGDPLVRYVSGAWQWSGTLPASQDYMIHAVSVGAATNYRLDISIE